MVGSLVIDVFGQESVVVNQLQVAGYKLQVVIAPTLTFSREIQLLRRFLLLLFSWRL
jgi:hypothetical protein